jgi:ribonuclease HII
MRCSCRFENQGLKAGHKLIAGADEVGRGSMFGPVVAAAVILDLSKPRIRGINDSKQLTAEVREKLDVRIRRNALAIGIAAVDAARIDVLNVYHASRAALRDAVLQLDPRPDLILVDAVTLDLPFPADQRAIVHGDALSVSIAAASIVAKVYRDQLMRDWDAVYPQYHLASNKGYYTRSHMTALREYGVSPLHRKNYLPVAQHSLFPVVLEQDPENLELFPEE